MVSRDSPLVAKLADEHDANLEKYEQLQADQVAAVEQKVKEMDDLGVPPDKRPC